MVTGVAASGGRHPGGPAVNQLFAIMSDGSGPPLGGSDTRPRAAFPIVFVIRNAQDRDGAVIRAEPDARNGAAARPRRIGIEGMDDEVAAGLRRAIATKAARKATHVATHVATRATARVTAPAAGDVEPGGAA